MESASIISNSITSNVSEVNKIIHCENVSDIKEVLKHLPITAVIPFFDHLVHYNPSNLLEATNKAKWINSILLNHFDLFKSLSEEERIKSLTPLTKHNIANTYALQKAYLWKSKLEFFKSIEDYHVLSSANAEEEDKLNRRSNIFSKDNESDTSDEEEIGGLSTLLASESEDNWDELSEMNAGNDDRRSSLSDSHEVVDLEDSDEMDDDEVEND